MKTFRNKNKESELRKTFEKNEESKERMRESSSIFIDFALMIMTIQEQEVAKSTISYSF